MPTAAKWVLHMSPGEGNGNPLQYSCLEDPMDGGAWWATVHGVTKSWTRLSDFTFTFHFHTLEKEMATHSSVLAWRIPGTGEPGGLPSMRSHRVGHDWRDLAAAAAYVSRAPFWQGPCQNAYNYEELGLHWASWTVSCDLFFARLLINVFMGGKPWTCFHYKYTNCQQGCQGGNPQSSFLSSYQTIIPVVYQEDPTTMKGQIGLGNSKQMGKHKVANIYSNGWLEIQIFRFHLDHKFVLCACLWAGY